MFHKFPYPHTCSSHLALGANDDVRLGFISCGGRAGQLMDQFAALDGVRIAGLCDPDSGRLGQAKEKYPAAETWSDLRELIDSPDTLVRTE